jgi:hypothetical protein
VSHHDAADLLIAAGLAGIAGFLLGRWTAIGGHAGPCDDDGAELDLTIGNQVLEPDEEPTMISKDFVIGDGPITLTLTPTHRGRPAKLDGPVEVVIEDESLFRATVGADGLSVTFEDQGLVGATTATIVADVRSGPERVEKTAIIGLNAIEGEADELGGSFGDQGGPPAGPTTPETPAPTEPTSPTETPPAETPPTP